MDLSRYLDLFVAESREHVVAAQDLASRLSAREIDSAALRELFRHSHSLKGMAGSMGYPAMCAVAHAIEDLLDVIRADPSAEAGPEEAAPILDGLACIERMIGAAARHESPDDPEAEAIAARLRALARAPAQRRKDAGREATPEKESAVAAEPAPAPRNVPVEPSQRYWQVRMRLRTEGYFPALQAASVLGRLGRSGRVVRADPPLAALRIGRFDGDLEAQLETDRAASEIEAELREIGAIEKFSLAPRPGEPAQGSAGSPRRTWVRVRADVLDSLLEKSLDLMLEQGRLAAAMDTGQERNPGADDAIARCGALLRSLYGDVMELRLVPFATVAGRLERSVHDLARTLGKKVRFEIVGRDVLIDRTILDALIDPFVHLLRNAIDHGIENPEARASAGKDPTGLVRLQLEREAERIRIVVEDDGRGLCAADLKRVAVARGLAATSEVARMSDAEALLLSTLPGLSTAAKPTEVSGRGVGMDVVRSAIEGLGGRLEIDSDPGRGARIRILLPLTLAVVQALLVRSRGDLFALPISSAERMLPLGEGTRRTAKGRPLLPEEEEGIELLPLDECLGLDGERPPWQGTRAVVVCPIGERRVGIVVDEVLGRREVVVRPLASPLRALETYSGAALLEDGSIVLVLDPASLAD